MTGRKSLRSAIDEKCRGCVVDVLAKGNWRQQVTLCSCYDCSLWDVRPVTKASIPQSVLDYYEIQSGDPCLESILRLSEGRNGRFLELAPETPCSAITEGAI